MTAPLYLVDFGALSEVAAGGQYRLDGAEGHHAARVRRARPGEPVDLADGSGRVARCRVGAVEPSALVLEVTTVDVIDEPRPAFVLVQALAKGGRDELAVETATELGVDRVVPWQAQHSVVVWSGERGRRAHGKWENVARAAAKQARRARVPRIDEPLTTAQLVQQVGERTASGDIVLVLDGEAEAALAGLEISAASGEVWLVVGPEGGISPQEIADLRGAGAFPVRLGSTVLRSSTAGPAALAVLSAAARW